MKHLPIIIFITLLFSSCAKDYNTVEILELEVKYRESHKVINFRNEYPTLFVEFNSTVVKTFEHKRALAKLMVIEYAIAAKETYAVVRVIENNREIIVETYKPEASYF